MAAIDALENAAVGVHDDTSGALVDDGSVAESDVIGERQRAAEDARLSADRTRYVAFPRPRQGGRLIRTVQEKERARPPTVYFMTSLTPPRPGPPARRIRGPWSIERRHWVRAVTCGDERSRLRGGLAPRAGPPCVTLRGP